MSRILVFAEQRAGELHPSVVQLITAAREIDNSAQISVCLIGHNLSALAQAIGKYGVQTVLTACNPDVQVPAGALGPEAMQRFLESLSIPNYKEMAPPPIAKQLAV